MASKPPVKKIGLSVQAYHLKNQFPASIVRVKKDMLTWIADIVPSPLSKKYKVRVRYRFGGTPEVNVIDPALTIPSGKRLPHTYPEERLCLYYPRASEWRSDMLLSQTIVPWISEWLFHYEVWLVTGEWCADGIHPRVKTGS